MRFTYIIIKGVTEDDVRVSPGSVGAAGSLPHESLYFNVTKEKRALPLGKDPLPSPALGVIRTHGFGQSKWGLSLVSWALSLALFTVLAVEHGN